MKQVLFLPGDGIGKEIVPQLERFFSEIGEVNIQYGLIGGSAIDELGSPFPEETLLKVKESDAVLLGAVGGPKWQHLPLNESPESGLLQLRVTLDAFANLRPAFLFDPLLEASSLKSDVIQNLDILIVRELVGGIYFGKPRGVAIDEKGKRYGWNTYEYHENEIERIARIAFDFAEKRSKKVCSVDKANVLEVTKLWREVVSEVSKEYPSVELEHMYVDNAAMQLVRNPKQFDVILTGNMFGDILSDIASMLTGSLGMLPSASLSKEKRGIYEPVHGSAPDIAGQNRANPLATILSIVMMWRYTFNSMKEADILEQSVRNILLQYRTEDIHEAGLSLVGTDEMVELVFKEFKELL